MNTFQREIAKLIQKELNISDHVEVLETKRSQEQFHIMAVRTLHHQCFVLNWDECKVLEQFHLREGFTLADLTIGRRHG